MREIGFATLDVHDQPREKMSTTRRLEHLNAQAQANGGSMQKKTKRRRTDSQMIKHFIAHGTWPSRFYLA